jgi:hypothetical protein
MRKYLILLVALAMVLGLTGIAMAGDITTAPITVNATVANYAAITNILSPSTLVFTGEANQTKTSNDGSATVETNCDVSVSVAVTAALSDGAGSTISTITAIDDNDFPLTPVTSVSQSKKTSTTHTIGVSGTTGAISGQAAGSYSGTITITVST